MTLASHLGKHLHELMGWPGPMTHRQFVLWSYWLREQWNKPSRTDHYLMQLTNEVQRPYRKNTGRIDWSKQFHVPFTSRVQTSTAAKGSEEQRKAWAAQQKAIWLGIVGVSGNRPPPQRG